jgi:hypothetical protein
MVERQARKQSIDDSMVDELIDEIEEGGFNPFTIFQGLFNRS